MWIIVGALVAANESGKSAERVEKGKLTVIFVIPWGLLPSHSVDPGWAGIGTDGEDKANKERGSKAGGLGRWDGLGWD